MEYSEKISINKELVLEFFLVLSRMEFALKVEGYCIGGNNRVFPDWGLFASEVGEKFSCGDNEKLSTAIDYYLGHPPKKQILSDGHLAWVDAPPNNATEVEKAIILVRRVRNNLFHGGKYNDQGHDEAARNEMLLEMGITIINGAMHYSPNVERAYNDSFI